MGETIAIAIILIVALVALVVLGKKNSCSCTGKTLEAFGNGENEMNEEYYIETWESKDGWRWRLMHENGNILADSEAYSSKQMMSKTADGVAETFKLKIVEAKTE
jgi:uncharacterized protein YegP (UPF0339 family)